jgi:hypothetical protein
VRSGDLLWAGFGRLLCLRERFYRREPGRDHVHRLPLGHGIQRGSYRLSGRRVRPGHHARLDRYARVHARRSRLRCGGGQNAKELIEGIRSCRSRRRSQGPPSPLPGSGDSEVAVRSNLSASLLARAPRGRAAMTRKRQTREQPVEKPHPPEAEFVNRPTGTSPGRITPGSALSSPRQNLITIGHSEFAYGATANAGVVRPNPTGTSTWSGPDDRPASVRARARH